MSQFVFGELIIKQGLMIKPSEITLSDYYPFSLRFDLKANDFHVPIAPRELLVSPFVVTDSCADNTAELLLQADCFRDNVKNISPVYANLLSLQLEEKIDLLVSSLKDIMSKTNCECILVISDGGTVRADFEKCSICDLGKKIKDLVATNPLFCVATYWIQQDDTK